MRINFRTVIHKQTALISGALFALTFTSCVDQEYIGGGNNNGTTSAVEEFFDYSTEKDVTLTIQYTSTIGKVPFEVFTQDPMKAYKPDESKDDVLYTRNLEVRPVSCGVTDKSGKFTGKIKLASSVEKIYVYTNSIGAQQSFEIAISGSYASATISSLPGVRSLKRGTETLTANFFTTNPQSDKISYLYGNGKWYTNGAPADEARTIEPMNTSIIEAANALRNNSVAGNPGMAGKSKTAEFLNRFLLKEDFTVAGNGEVVLNVLSTQCALPSTLAYYVYEEGDINPNDPASLTTLENLQKYIILPLARAQDAEMGNPKPLTGIAGDGNSTTIKLINPDNQNDPDTKYNFKAGTKIGFALLLAGDISDLSNYYPELIKTNKISYTTAIAGKNALIVPENPTGNWGITYNYHNYPCQMAVSIKVPGLTDLNGKALPYEVFGFEHDRWQSWPDYDFDDVIFGVSNIKGTEKPIVDLPEVELNKKGMLLYEDLWPSKGDYDMNDLVVHYDIIHTVNAENTLLLKTEYNFKLLWAGATLYNSFEIQLPKSAKDIEDLCTKSIAGYENGVIVSALEQLNATDRGSVILKVDNPNISATEGRIVQICKDIPVLFNMGGPLIPGVEEANYKFVVTYNDNTPATDANHFNPFIDVKNKSREVHLIGEAPTSQNQGSDSFDKDNDRSYTAQSDGKKYWYASANYLPFAINVVDPGDNSVLALDFYKTNEKVFISDVFPDFIKWASKEPGYERWWDNYVPASSLPAVSKGSRTLE